MGSTNQIKETNISLQLRDKECSQCKQPFTQPEISDRNYDFWFDTTNDVSLIPMEEIQKKKMSNPYYKELYFPFRRTGYQFSIWIRSIEHQNCPDKEAQPC